MELQTFLEWVIASGGAGIATFFLIQEVKALATLAPAPKRYAAIAISGGIAVAAYLAMVLMGYAPTPQAWNTWVEQVFLYASTGFGLSQIIHGTVALAKGRT